jgi:hypothetical protein
MFEDEYQDHGPEEIQRDLTERAKKDFMEGCYQAYDILVKDGGSALLEAELPSIQRAINRMTAFFIIREEFEKCQFLKNFVKENIPGFEITPDETIERDLNA